MRDQKTKESFIKYLEDHPKQRFWQAVRNWSGVNFVWTSDVLVESPFLEDTFYLEDGVETS
jgi:hypothetical protein